MIASKSLAAQLTFIRFADSIDAQAFKAYDLTHGLGNCAYVKEGIVCNVEDEQQYIKIMNSINQLDMA